MLECSITLKGHYNQDLTQALQEIIRLLEEGNTSGINSNNESEFSFTVSGTVGPEDNSYEEDLEDKVETLHDIFIDSDWLSRNGYTCTDASTGQYAKEIKPKRFNVYERSNQQMNLIDLSQYPESEILDTLKTYGYLSVEDVIKQYQQEADMVIAECISEMEIK